MDSSLDVTARLLSKSLLGWCSCKQERHGAQRTDQARMCAVRLRTEHVPREGAGAEAEVVAAEKVDVPPATELGLYHLEKVHERGAGADAEYDLQRGGVASCWWSVGAVFEVFDTGPLMVQTEGCERCKGENACVHPLSCA